MRYQDLVGKYLNGYKIVKVEDDPFIKGQVNLWTDEQTVESFGDRSIIKFFIRDDSNEVKIYQELTDKENYNLKKALNEIKIIIEECKKLMPHEFDWEEQANGILEKIDKILGGKL